MEKKIDEPTHIEDTTHPGIHSINHDDKAVWDQGRAYGPSGIRGLASSKYVLAAATFSTMGGMLFGYE